MWSVFNCDDCESTTVLCIPHPWGVWQNGIFYQFFSFISSVKRTHCSLRFDHVVWPLAATAVFHGIPGLLVEDDAEEEDKGTLWGGQKREGKGLGKPKNSKPDRSILQGKWRAHLQTVESSEQVVEDDDVAVYGEESQKTCDWNQEEDATCCLQAWAAEYGSHETEVTGK